MSHFQMRPATKLTPPYAAYSTHLEMLERVRQNGIPADIQSSAEIRGDLGDSNFAQMVRAWRYLGLVDDQQKPTETLVQLVHASEDEYRRILRGIVASSYSFLYESDTDQPSSVPIQTLDELRQRFELQGATGSTVRRSISFFIKLADDAGVRFSEKVASELKDGPSMLSPSSSRAESVSVVDHPITSAPKGYMVQAHARSSLGEMLLAKLPAFDPSWSSEERSAWLHSFDLVASIIKREKESGP